MKSYLSEYLPTSPLALLRTKERIITSASDPWNESTVSTRGPELGLGPLPPLPAEYEA